MRRSLAGALRKVNSGFTFPSAWKIDLAFVGDQNYGKDMTTRIEFRTRAPFLIDNRWLWITWSNHHGNKHAAILEKATELSATAWDFGQADHYETSRAGF